MFGRPLLVSLLGLLSWGFAYSPLELSTLANLETPQKVRVQGLYTADRETTALIRGVVSSGTVTLPVEGTVFDWRPQSGTPVDLWGVLEERPSGPVLIFHNGRNPGDDRRPRPTPELVEGETVTVWLQVTTAGSAPAPIMQGVSEDRITFLLPRYEGSTGLVCVTGDVTFLSVLGTQRPALTNARPCRT